MSLQNIFTEDQGSQNGKKLPNEFANWQEEILKEIYKVAPETTNHLIRIEWKKKDEERGYGVASGIIRKKNDNARAIVPIIVKAFKLAPIDVFVVNGVFMPFNEYIFNKYFISRDIFSGVVARTEYDLASPYGVTNLYDETHPPFHAKQGSVLESILETLDADDIKNFKQSLLDNPDSFAKLAYAKPISNKIKKVCGFKPRKIEKKASLSDDVLCIERFGFNKFKVMSNNSDYFNPKSEIWDYSLLKKAGIDKAVLENNYLFKAGKNKSNKTPFVEEDYDMMNRNIYPVVDANSTGTYVVKSTDGSSYTGVVIPLVIGFDEKPQKTRLFISGCNFAYQPKIAGFKKADEIKLSECNLEAGKTGTFIYESKHGALATEPFEVESMSTDDKNMIVYARTLLGVAVKLVVSPGIKSIVKSQSEKNTFFIPGSMRFIKLDRQIPVLENEKAISRMIKTASMNSDPLVIINNDGTYSFKGKMLEKYASVNGVNFDFSLVKPFEAKYLLMSFGCDTSAADHILKTANAYQSIRVYDLNFPKVVDDIDVELANRNNKFRDLYKHAEDMKCDMVKEAGALVFANDKEELSSVFVRDNEYKMYKIAANIDSDQVVDDVLSLGFINPNNLKIFVGMKQHLELSASKLAQLLIASRLGVKTIPEKDTSAAMSNLSYVIEGLDLLENTI